MPTGLGLLTYATMDEAVEALRAVESDYVAHSSAARALAAEYFAAERVLGRMLTDAGLG